MPSARVDSPGPSHKALGKRKAGPTAAVDGAAPPPPPKTRVLPSRARKVGNHGVGGTEIDEIVLDVQRRKFENEPLLPLDTQLLATTDFSTLTAISSTQDAEAHVELNQDAFARYFDRPEVIRACRDMETIQTPDFREIPVAASVSGRTRARHTEDKAADINDDAYERRHRKYEQFEKRQRLREREKLKHLQYKLNERVDVLRAMEPTAFLALPATDFSPAPPPPPVAEDGDALHANGAPAHREGLRRRDEMLANARVLAEKYAQLLPPDRPRPPTKKNAMDDTDDEVPAPSALKKAPSKARGMAVFVSAPAEEWEVDDGSGDEFRPEVKKGKKRPKSGKAKGPAPEAEAVAVAASMSMSMSASTSQADPMDIDGPPPTASPPPSPPSSKPNGKRRRASSPAPTVETSASASVALSTKPKRKPQQRALILCHLERAAQHRASGRRAPRNVQPFGMDIPGSLELRLLFDFPAWAHPQDRDSGWAARDGEDHMVGEDGDEDEEEDGDPPDIVGIVPAATPPPPQPQPVSRPGRGRKPKAKPAPVVESEDGDDDEEGTGEHRESDTTAVEASDAAGSATTPVEDEAAPPKAPLMGPYTVVQDQPSWTVLAPDVPTSHKPASQADLAAAETLILQSRGR